MFDERAMLQTWLDILVALARAQASLGLVPRAMDVTRPHHDRGLDAHLPRGRLALVDARGPGFGTASARERTPARVAFRSEGLLFDHTYGAEALAVAVDGALARPDGPVLLWHTGGIVPAVASAIREKGSP